MRTGQQNRINIADLFAEIINMFFYKIICTPDWYVHYFQPTAPTWAGFLVHFISG